MVSAEAVFITGRGWVNVADVTCQTCGDDGRIVTGWADDGDAENGPDPYATDFDYCDCEAGTKAKDDDEAMSEGYIRIRMAQDGKSREQVLADIAEEDAYNDRMEQRHRFMEICGLTEGDIVDDTGSATTPIGYTPAPTFDDDALAAKVWLCVDRESLYATDANDYDIDDPDHQDRLQYALDRLGELAEAMFPNATDWWIQECNNYSPRIEDAHGNSHEHAFDIMIDLDDKATSAAWTAFPAPEPNLDKQFMIEDMLNRHAITDEEAEGLIDLHADDVEGRYIESLTQTGATELS